VPILVLARTGTDGRGVVRYLTRGLRAIRSIVPDAVRA
jgi:hypothetical protein